MFLNSTMMTSFLFAAAAQSSAIKLEVIFSETANLTYQLDTVAGLLRASDPRDFQALWKERFLRSNEDHAQLAKWAALRRKYSVSAELPSLPMQLAPRQSNISLGENIRSVGLGAQSLEAYELSLADMVLPADVHQFVDIVRYFQPRFRIWWQSEAATMGHAFTTGMQRLLSDPKVTEQVERFRKFYGSTLPNGYKAPFSLIYRPMLVLTPTSGQQLGRMSVVEFPATEKPERRLEVVLHEFCHFLYGTRAPHDDQNLQIRFADANEVGARPSYNLMNEALATALGNGVIGRMFRAPGTWTQYLETPRSFYNNEHIDRAGKRILKVMDEWLPNGKTMNDPDFVPTYIAALKQEFGEEITTPSLFLNESYIFVSEQIGADFVGKIIQIIRISSAWAISGEAPDKNNLADFKEHPNLSAIFVIPPTQLEVLTSLDILKGPDVAAIKKALGGQKSATYLAPRGSMAYSLVIVADDVAEAERRLNQISAMRKMVNGVNR